MPNEGSCLLRYGTLYYSITQPRKGEYAIGLNGMKQRPEGTVQGIG